VNAIDATAALRAQAKRAKLAVKLDISLQKPSLNTDDGFQLCRFRKTAKGDLSSNLFSVN
jgi:hypothetical protein